MLGCPLASLAFIVSNFGYCFLPPAGKERDTVSGKGHSVGAPVSAKTALHKANPKGSHALPIAHPPIMLCSFALHAIQTMRIGCLEAIFQICLQNRAHRCVQSGTACNSTAFHGLRHFCICRPAPAPAQARPTRYNDYYTLCYYCLRL